MSVFISATTPLESKYGGPRIVVKYVPSPGEVIEVVYRSKKDLQIGDPVTLSPPGYEMPGIVVGTSAEEPRYQNIELCGGKVKNMGKGYYQVKVLEIPT